MKVDPVLQIKTLKYPQELNRQPKSKADQAGPGTKQNPCPAGSGWPVLASV